MSQLAKYNESPPVGMLWIELPSVRGKGVSRHCAITIVQMRWWLNEKNN